MKKKGMSALCLCLALGLSAFTGEVLAQTEDVVVDSSAPSVPLQATGSQQGTVNINTATAQQLTELQGVGARRAEAIVQYREEHGPFGDIEQLQEVPGIGPMLIENNRSRLVL